MENTKILKGYSKDRSAIATTLIFSRETHAKLKSMATACNISITRLLQYFVDTADVEALENHFNHRAVK